MEVKILKVPVGRRHHFVIQLSGDSMVDEFQIELRQFVEQFDLGKKRDPINLAPYQMDRFEFDFNLTFQLTL